MTNSRYPLSALPSNICLTMVSPFSASLASIILTLYPVIINHGKLSPSLGNFCNMEICLFICCCSGGIPIWNLITLVMLSSLFTMFIITPLSARYPCNLPYYSPAICSVEFCPSWYSCGLQLAQDHQIVVWLLLFHMDEEQKAVWQDTTGLGETELCTVNQLRQSRRLLEHLLHWSGTHSRNSEHNKNHGMGWNFRQVDTESDGYFNNIYIY